MNALLAHGIAGRRRARKMKLHVYSLVRTGPGAPHGRDTVAAPRCLHLAKTQFVSALFHPGEKFAHALLLLPRPRNCAASVPRAQREISWAPISKIWSSCP